jgi:hypothetical protein
VRVDHADHANAGCNADAHRHADADADAHADAHADANTDAAWRFGVDKPPAVVHDHSRGPARWRSDGRYRDTGWSGS